eukprot:1154863-Pelagomonas_calceolata.AAC.3
MFTNHIFASAKLPSQAEYPSDPTTLKPLSIIYLVLLQHQTAANMLLLSHLSSPRKEGHIAAAIGPETVWLWEGTGCTSQGNSNPGRLPNPGEPFLHLNAARLGQQLKQLLKPPQGPLNPHVPCLGEIAEGTLLLKSFKQGNATDTFKVIKYVDICTHLAVSAVTFIEALQCIYDSEY